MSIRSKVELKPFAKSPNWKTCTACGALFEDDANLQVEFDNHVKKWHSPEDVNQAAARIVREATERD